MQQNHDKFDRENAGAVSCLLLPLFLLSVHTKDQFLHVHRRQCSRAELPSSAGQNHRAGDQSTNTEKPHLTAVLHSMHDLWLAHPQMVCDTFDKINPPGDLVDATNHKSSHAFTLSCGTFPVNVLGAEGDSILPINMHMIRCNFVLWHAQNRQSFKFSMT